jgi:hypothetical protein
MALQVMVGDDGVHPSCTVPETPVAPVISSPKYAVPPGVAVAVVEPPAGIEMITCAFVPVPFSETDCGLPVALSAMLNVAARTPVAVGVNVTLIVQLAFTPKVPDGLHVPAPAPLPNAKSLLLAPIIEKPAKLTADDPVLLTAKLSAPLVVPTACEPYVKLLGVTVTVAVPPVPVPVSVTICGLPAALSVNVIVPVRGPVAVGVNVIENTHGAASTAMLGHCASVAPAKSPDVTMLVNVTVTPPMFDTVTACAALVVPTV